MRDTAYATELVPPAVTGSGAGDESRMERILVKGKGTVEIRFSWWRNGNIVSRPLDLPQEELAELLERGFGTVLDDAFLVDLRDRIEAHLARRSANGARDDR